LVDKDVASGRRILEALARAGVPVTVSSWIYFPELSEWQFFIATPLVDRKGPRGAYGQVLTIMTKEDILPEFPLRRVFLIGPDHPIAERIRANLKAGENQAHQVVNVPVADGFARDAYVYLGGSVGILLDRDKGDFETNIYSVMFYPYSGPGGAVPAKKIEGLEELRYFLQTKLRVEEQIVDAVLEELRKVRRVTIPSRQLMPGELKRLGLV